MRLAAVRIFLTCAALSIPLIVLSAMRSGGSPFAASPAEIVIEGVVVQGETYRVEPIDAAELAIAQGGIEAEVRVTNRRGEVVRATSDSTGHFRVGPIEVAGDEQDVMTVSAPSHRTLSMSCLPPAATTAGGEGGGPKLVRWRIALPRRQEPETPAAPAAPAGEGRLAG